CPDVYEVIYAGDGAFTELARRGGRPQCLLWASTGVNEPAYPDTMYVSSLVPYRTVHSIPFATMVAIAERDTVDGGYVRCTWAASGATVDALRAEGIDLDEVFGLLERQGVEKFVTAWDGLIDTVRSRVDEIPSGS